MAKENDDTQPEGTESEESEESEDAAAQAILARALGKKPAGKPADDVDESDEDDSAEVEAGVSDTVPRSEMIKAIKARQAAKAKTRELTQELAALRQQNETESEKKVREAEEKIAKALTNKYKPALVRTGAEAALLAAGPKKGKEGIPRLIKLMDMDAIDLTEELELEGVEEEVVRLQEEYPELFGGEPVEEPKEEKPAPRRRTTSRQVDGAGKKPPTTKKSTSEMILAKLRGDDL